jgi:F-type H+-transporting ATPase subunit gamma
MSDTTASLRRKIGSAGDLQSVVRTMKALAASSIGQYEQSVRALADYYRTMELGLGVCFREIGPAPLIAERKRQTDAGRLARSCSVQTRDWWASLMMPWPICGQDARGSAGQSPRSGPSVSAFMRAWRTQACRWWDSSPCRIPSRPSPRSSGRFSWRARRATARVKSPNSTSSTTAPRPGAVYAPVSQRLLPLDEAGDASWPNFPGRPGNLPEVMGGGTATLRALIREYLFVSLFRACAESLASENASRLAAMQRADKNIDELLEELNGHSIVCARVASTRNCSTSSPASKH